MGAVYGPERIGGAAVYGPCFSDAAIVTGAGGIASSEAFGSPTATGISIRALSGAGAIASAEAFGSPVFSLAPGPGVVADAGGIASDEAFGAPTVTSIGPSTSVAAIVAAIFGRVIEDGITFEELLRIIAAPLSGKADGIGTATERYYSRDGTKPRVTATFDSQGNRTEVVIDGTP